MKIGQHDYEEFLDIIKAFHGNLAPGIVMGGFMVDLAYQNLPEEGFFDAVAETLACLPDVIQLLTPCTIGNGWLKILNWGKFALSLYDKKQLTGYRVWFDVSKASQFPNLYNWYMRKVLKKDLPIDILLDSIFAAGKDVLSSRAITITNTFSRGRKGETELCTDCGEVFPTAQGAACTACQGNAYYETLSE